MKKNIETFWRTFLKEKGLDMSTSYIECFHFDVHEASANHLLQLVLEGKKKATASSVYAFAQGQEPKVGDYSIVTDWDENPCCVIQTTATKFIPFNEMTYEICKREGEDDNLQSWQEGHARFFACEGAQLGYTFSEDMLVLFEDFEVVYVNK